MLDKTLFKTKLCIQYQNGHCRRNACSFAHGTAELRRSFNGRQDLREKLERRSPIRRYSPLRDDRRKYPSHGENYPRSPERRSDPIHRKKEQSDDESDDSGSLKSSDNDKKQGSSSSDSRDTLNDQFKQAQSKINRMVDHKRQLELNLEKSGKEIDNLTSKVDELEMQLNREKDECKRITSKIKKFVKAHTHHSRLQQELKRSYDQLQKMGEKLNSEFMRLDSVIPDSSDEELASDTVLRSRKERNKNVHSSRKRPRISEFNQGNLINGDETIKRKHRSEKVSQENVRYTHSESKKTNELNLLSSEEKSRGENNSVTENLFPEKSKGSESSFTLPTTSMAAHALDEAVEIVDEAVKIQKLPLPPPPPPPPIPQNTSILQYHVDDNNADIDGVDEEMGDMDVI